MKTRLPLLRKEYGLSQAELAKKLHLGKSTIAGYELEVREMPYSVIFQLSQLFDCSIDYLLGNSNIRNADKNIVFNPFVEELYNEVKDLTPEQQQDILKLVKTAKELFK